MLSWKIVLILLVGALVFYLIYRSGRRWLKPVREFPASWRKILKKEVDFYKKLDPPARKRFEYKLQEFLLNVDIVGIKTTVTDRDRVLIGASAVIPIFSFPEWRYLNLDEVLLYPNRFSEDFDLEGDHRSILGMVGSGYMDRKMILSKRALYDGFKYERDKRNTAIHEFVHLVDKMDGETDGVPKVLLSRQYILPWLDLMEKEFRASRKGNKDIDPYGYTNRQEFFAVLGEYFFERPHLLHKKHPELYEGLSRIFRYDPVGKDSPSASG